MQSVKIETCTTEAQCGPNRWTVNGYTIRYNTFWKTYQVSHPEIAALVAEFDHYEEAEEHCKNG